MADIIKPKRSATAAAAPTTGNLVEGEIALNMADNLLYFRDDANTIKTIDIANLDSFDTDDLGEGSTNRYYADELVDDRVANLLTEGTNITLTYNDSAGTLTVAVDNTGGLNLANNDTDDLSEGSTNLYYTDERVEDAVANLLTEGTNISLTYGDTAGTLTVAVDNTGGLDLANNDTDDLSEGSTNLYYTDERVDDRVSNLLLEGDNITLTYNDSANTLTVATTDAVVIESGTPTANEIGVWTAASDGDPAESLTSVTGFTFTDGTLSVPGDLFIDNGSLNVTDGASGSLFMEHNGTRASITTDDELAFSASLLLFSTTTNPHFQLQYGAGDFTNGILYHDDTDFTIGTDDYTANTTRIKLDPMGNIVWSPTGVKYGIGTNAPNVALDIQATDAMRIPSGTDLQRPSPELGHMRYNTDSSIVEIYTTEWTDISGNVKTTGIPSVGQVPVFTTDDVVDGSSDLTFSSNTLSVTGDILMTGGYSLTIDDGTSSADSVVISHDGARGSIISDTELGLDVGTDNLIKILPSQITMLTGDVFLENAGTDSLLSMNKNATADNASILFQTNATNNASFGLEGDDNFTIKLGSSLDRAMVMQNDLTRTDMYTPELNLYAANESGIKIRTIEEELTNLSGATATTTASFPNQSIILGVSCRVTEAITGPNFFDVGDGTTSGRFGGSLNVALNTSNQGTIGPSGNYGTTTVTLTAVGGNFTGGSVRVALHYMELIPPLSV